MGGHLSLPDVFNFINSQSLGQPLHWKYPKKSQILQRFPQILQLGGMTLLIFSQKPSQHFSVTLLRASQRGPPLLVGYGHSQVTRSALRGLIRTGKDATLIYD